MGHLEVVREALRSGLDQLVVMPCRVSPHKLQTPALGAMEDRWAMLELAFHDVANVSLSRHELDGPVPSYTYKTLAHLQKKHPGARLMLILGLDQLHSLDRWARYGEWAAHIGFLAFNREGSPAIDLPKKYAKLDLQFIEKKVSPLSSSSIRERIRRGQGIDGLVTPAVERYIRQHHLYTPPKQPSL